MSAPPPPPPPRDRAREQRPRPPPPPTTVSSSYSSSSSSSLSLPRLLWERSQSQNNTLAIRIVPYSPPRLGRSSDSPQHAETPSGNDGEQGSDATSSKWVGAAGNEVYASSPGSALSSPPSPPVLLAGPGYERVSGSKPATVTGHLYSSPPSTPALSSTVVPSSITSTSTSTTAAGSGNNSSFLKTPTAAPSQRRYDHDRHHHQEHAADDPASPTSSTPRPLSRRRNFIAVHSDKTFSLVPRGAPTDARGSVRSPPLSSSTVRSSSSHERLSSSAALSDDRLSSPPTTSATLPDARSLSPFTPSLTSWSSSPPGSSTVLIAEDPIAVLAAPPAAAAAAAAPASSPWNYHMVGGLRKVPKTPDLTRQQQHYQKKNKNKGATAAYATSSRHDTPLLPLPEIVTSSSPPLLAAADETPSRRPRVVAPKASFASVSTFDDTTNYKIYSHSSSPLDSVDSLPRPLSSDSNVQILGASSPPAPLYEADDVDESSLLRSSDSEQNYVLHGDPSSSPTPLAVASRNPRPTFSQESLKVAPLQPARQRSNERFGYFKSRSRESLRHAASIKSFSSIISQDSIAPFLVAPAFVNFRGGPANITTPGSSSQAKKKQKPDSWATTPVAAIKPSDPGPTTT